MFDFGFAELIIVVILVILIVPPKDIPRVFQTLGDWYRRLLQIYHGIMNEIQEITDQDIEIKKPKNTKPRG